MIYKITIVHANRSVEDLVLYSHPSWPVMLGGSGDPVPGWKAVYTIEEGVDKDADMKPVVFKESVFSDIWIQLPRLEEERAAGRTFVLKVECYEHIADVGEYVTAKVY